MNKQSERVLFHHYVKATNVLGPGMRSALWVSGCDKKCKGCLVNGFNEDSRCLSTTALAELFANMTDTEGITISGGEPFLQAAALAEMISLIKEKRDYSVIIYTGYEIEQLRNMEDVNIQKLINAADIIIDGPYIEELDDGIAYRGSSNQNIIYLTQRYTDSGYYNKRSKRQIELIKENGVKMVGVPNTRQLNMWSNLKKQLERCKSDEEDL